MFNSSGPSSPFAAGWEQVLFQNLFILLFIHGVFPHVNAPPYPQRGRLLNAASIGQSLSSEEECRADNSFYLNEF